MDDRAAQQNSQDLEDETERARSMTMDLKARVQNLERNRGTGAQAQNRLQQVSWSPRYLLNGSCSCVNCLVGCRRSMS